MLDACTVGVSPSASSCNASLSPRAARSNAGRTAAIRPCSSARSSLATPSGPAAAPPNEDPESVTEGATQRRRGGRARAVRGAAVRLGARRGARDHLLEPLVAQQLRQLDERCDQRLPLDAQRLCQRLEETARLEAARLHGPGKLQRRCRRLDTRVRRRAMGSSSSLIERVASAATSAKLLASTKLCVSEVTTPAGPPKLRTACTHRLGL